VGDDVAGLLALVADAVLLAGAVTAQVANLAAVVALLALGAVARHVAIAAAREASLGTTTGSTESTLLSTVAGSSAVAGNVTDLAALVALSAAGGTTTGAVRGSAVVLLLRGRLACAVARDVTSLAAPVARLLLCRLGAVTAQMSILATVVADGVAALGALARLMANLIAVVAGTSALSSSTEIHFIESRRGVVEMRFGGR